MTVAAVILAGGKGTRLRSALPTLPKPMAPAQGRPFLEWVICFLKQQGVRHVGLSTCYLSEVIAAHFTPCPVSGMEIRVVKEEEPLGTAGGFHHTAAGLGVTPDHWLVMNADSLIITDLKQVLEAARAEDADAALLSCHREDAARYGSIETDENGWLAGFHEKRPGSAWINAGIYLFPHRSLAAFPRQRPLSFETDVFPEFLAAGKRIKVVKAGGAFLDIGLPETFAQADTFIHQNQAWFAPR